VDEREIYFTVDQREDGRLQLSINESDAGGYRLAGPKYDGSSINVLKRRLDQSDVQVIRSYLRRVPKEPKP